MTTLQHPPMELAPPATRAVLPGSDELSGRLAQHLVANALVRKSVNDPVPFPVWWRVTDALRASVLAAPADAVSEVDAAVAALVAQVRGLTVGPAVSHPLPAEDVGRSLRLAQVLLARLVFATAPTSPTLLHVRLARLRRALVAATPG
jgi:hypothetical protein